MNRVLIIEDNPETMSEIETSFIENSISSIKCLTHDEALAAIRNDIPFDAVILDWFFVLEEDSSLSKLLLNELRQKQFRPVFVYAGTIEDYNQTSDAEIPFPRNLISGYSKAVTPDELREEISKKITENYSLRLSNVYRNTISRNLEKVFFEINELQNVDLARVLNKIYGDGSNIDWSNDLLLNLLHRSLISDLGFINELTAILQAANNINEGISADDRKKIANKILYFHSQSDFIRNGDIAEIKKASDNSTVGYGIVITPDCDLEQSRSQYIDLVELVKFNDAKLALNVDNQRKIKSYNHDSFYLFQSLLVENILQDFIAVLKSRIILREIAENYHVNYPKASKRLLYSQEFIHNGERIRLGLLCTKVNPYKAEFLQKLHTSSTRVGIPDIKDLL